MADPTAEEILKKLRIEYFERSGRLAFRCPFHDDNDPSAGFYIDTGLAHCFSCEYTLDPIQFYAKFQGLRRSEAIRDLEKDYGPISERKRHINRTLMALIRARSERKLARIRGKIPREVHATLGETLDRVLLAYEREQILEDKLQVAMDRWGDRIKDLTKDHQYGTIEGKENAYAGPDKGRIAETDADDRLEEGSRNLSGTRLEGGQRAVEQARFDDSTELAPVSGSDDSAGDVGESGVTEGPSEEVEL